MDEKIETPSRSVKRWKNTSIKNWAFRSMFLAILLAGGAYFSPKLFYIFSHESTDNAYVCGTIVPISAEIKGKVVAVFVDDNQFVNEGEALVRIYCKDYEALVSQQKSTLLKLKSEYKEIEALIREKKKLLVQLYANKEIATAEEALAIKEYRRFERLVKNGAVSQSDYDYNELQQVVSRAKKKKAEAEVEETREAIEALENKLIAQKFKISEADAALSISQLNLDRTTIKAPLAGRIAKKNVDVGKYVEAGQTLLSIVDEMDLWIVANFKETQLRRMRVGQPVDIEVDTYPGIRLKGHIDSFQPGTGSVFSLLPPENATGNFVKVVQRVPVKIVMDPPADPNYPLYPGMSVIPHVDTGQAS